MDDIDIDNLFNSFREEVVRDMNVCSYCGSDSMVLDDYVNSCRLCGTIADEVVLISESVGVATRKRYEPLEHWKEFLRMSYGGEDFRIPSWLCRFLMFFMYSDTTLEEFDVILKELNLKRYISHKVFIYNRIFGVYSRECITYDHTEMLIRGFSLCMRFLKKKRNTVRFSYIARQLCRVYRLPYGDYFAKPKNSVVFDRMFNEACLEYGWPQIISDVIVE